MLIVPELETVIIQPPRTGSSALRDAILARYSKAFSPHRHMERDGTPYEYWPYKKVGIIRHPCARLWSLYKFMRWCPRPRETEAGTAWVNRIIADASRPFRQWLLNSLEPFTDADVNGNCTSDYYRTRWPKPAARKSQYEFLRPDIGPITIFKMENPRDIELHFNITLRRSNESLSAPEPEWTDDMRAHMWHYHSWDLDQYNAAGEPGSEPYSITPYWEVKPIIQYSLDYLL